MLGAPRLPVTSMDARILHCGGEYYFANRRDDNRLYVRGPMSKEDAEGRVADALRSEKFWADHFRVMAERADWTPHLRTILSRPVQPGHSP